MDGPARRYLTAPGRPVRALLPLLAANGVSAAIQGQFMFVLPWMLLARGRPPRDAALAGALVFLPMLAATVPAGVVSDRSDPIRLMRRALLLGLAACALYPLARALGRDPFWLVLLAAAVTGGLRLFVEGAALRAVGDVGSPAGLVRGQAVRSTVNQAAVFASPFLGLLVFHAGGEAAVLAGVCGLYGLALACLALAVPGRIPAVTGGKRAMFRRGAASMRASRRLRLIGGASLVWNVWAGAALGLMPAVLREHLGLGELEASLALVLAGVAVVVLTTRLVARAVRRRRVASVFLLAVAAQGAVVLLFVDVRVAVAAPLLLPLFLLVHSAAAATLSGARALEVDPEHQALLNLTLIALAIVGYLAGVALAAGLVGLLGFGAVLVLIAAGLAGTAAAFRGPLLRAA